MRRRFADGGLAGGVRPWAVLAAGVMMALLFFSGSQQDLITTGNNSWKLWDSRFFDFYEVTSAWGDGHTANYMPSTYILFGLWVLPLKLLGFAEPATLGTAILPYIWWYKLLPVLFYIACVYLVYKIALQMEFGTVKAQWCAFAFATAPIAVYSQFIFSQYDSFTVFFMLLGIYYYQKEDSAKFVASFAVALSFKYYVILFFMVLLLLKEKRIGYIFRAIFAVASFVMAYLVVFLRSEAFRSCVFGFSALGYMSQADFSTILGNISFMPVVCVLIAAWAYFVEVKDRADLARWAVYLCCGECFALFGLSTFHPQWLLIAVPFWMLAMFMHKRFDALCWLDMLLSAVFLLFTFGFWKGSADDTVLYNGAWRALLNGRVLRAHIADMIPYHNLDRMYTVIFAVLLIFFLFNHPKYGIERFREYRSDSARRLLYARCALGVALFAVPAAQSVMITMRQDPIVAINQTTADWLVVSRQDPLEQVFAARYPVLSGMKVTLAYESEGAIANTESKLGVELIDIDSGKTLFRASVEPNDIDDKMQVYLDAENLNLSTGDEYAVRFSVEGSGRGSWRVASSTAQADASTGYYSVVGGVRSYRALSIELYQKERA